MHPFFLELGSFLKGTTRMALHAKKTLFAEGRTYTIKEFKYALEAGRKLWRLRDSRLLSNFHCNA
jgi:hypothetical protein